MKLPITDKFLWEVYTAITETKDFIASLNKQPNLWNFAVYDVKDPVYKKYRKEMGARNFSKFISYLKRKNYIHSENLKGEKATLLTKAGIGKALRASFILEQKRKRKDGKWIMLAFDMPAKNKRLRTLMRSILYNLGYKLLQHSLWITPYDVSEKTEELLQFYNLDRYVKIFLIEKT